MLMRYRAKVDWRIGTAVVLGLAAPAVVAVVEGTAWWLVWSGASALLTFGACYPQWYEMGSDALVIRAGLRTRRLPYAEITAVRISSDSRSSAALSLDRVSVESTRGTFLIAPERQDEFFADLLARAPQLARRGQDLVLSLG